MESLQLTDPVQLRSDITRYMSSALTDLIGTASNIAAQTQNRVVRERALRYKIQAAEGLRLLHREQDPRLLYVILWIKTAQHRQSLTEGPSKQLFGEQQSLAVELVQRQEAGLVEIGRKYFGDDAIDAARDDIEQLAVNAPPMSLMVSVPMPEGVAASAKKNQDLLSILRLPLAPIQTASDVNAGIAQLNLTAQLMLETLRNMPQRVRWEAELLLLEAESLQVVSEFSEHFNRLILQLEETNVIARQMPAELSAETRKVLEELHDAQPRLQATLQQAETLVIGVGEASGELESLAEQVRGLVTDIERLCGEPGPSGTSEAPSVDEIAAVTTQVHETVLELRGLVSDLENSPALTRAGEQARGLVDRLTVRGILLIAVAFVVALVYRWIVRRYLAD